MGNHLDQCKKGTDGEENELDIRLAEAQRLEKQIADLQNQNQALERENRNLQSLTQELMDAREEAPVGNGQEWVQQVAEAQAQADEVAAENLRLQQRLVQLEEQGEMQALRLEETVAELEERRRREAEAPEAPEVQEEAGASPPMPARELAAVQAERRAWLEEKAQLEQALSERKADLERTEELAQKLQEEHAEAMSKLATLQVSTAPSRDEPADGMAQTLRAEERERLRRELEMQIGGGQAEIARLRAENRALSSQCQSLAEMAEQACTRAEEARARFEKAESTARSRQGALRGDVATAETPRAPGAPEFAEVRLHFANHLPSSSAPAAALEPSPRGPTTPSQAGSEHPLSVAASTIDAGLHSGLNSGVNTPMPRVAGAQSFDTAAAAQAPQQPVASGRKMASARVVRADGVASYVQTQSPQSTLGMSSGPPSSVLLVPPGAAPEAPPLPPSPIGCSARIRLPTPVGSTPASAPQTATVPSSVPPTAGAPAVAPLAPQAALQSAMAAPRVAAAQQPRVAQIQAAQPQAAQPLAAQPLAAQPQAAQPLAAQPQAAVGGARAPRDFSGTPLAAAAGNAAAAALTAAQVAQATVASASQGVMRPLASSGQVAAPLAATRPAVVGPVVAAAAPVGEPVARTAPLPGHPVGQALASGHFQQAAPSQLQPQPRQASVPPAPPRTLSSGGVGGAPGGLTASLQHGNAALLPRMVGARGAAVQLPATMSSMVR